MISLHTNLSSLVTQQNLATSTTKLNTAIERLTTGYKINHAGDNAANYSISKNMSVQLSACDVAADNISMGMDLLQTAQDTIAGMQDRGSRIHALITQARNGTYGADSLNAMTQEAAALVSEINRLYVNTEYNGIKLFDNVVLPDWAQEVKNTAGKIDGKSLEECALEHNGFIQEVVEETPDVTITDPTQLASAISSNTKIGIGNAETLAKLAELVNAGTATCEGKTIILTNDIDLSAYHDGEGWTPIGNDSNKFQGTFNGNGHKITGLYINRLATTGQGFFGYITGEITNVGIEGYVKGGDCAGLLVCNTQGDIINCYTTGYVESERSAGGLVQVSGGSIYDSYSECDVYITTDNNSSGGGLAAMCNYCENCFATGDVKSNALNASQIGGLLGKPWGNSMVIRNCFATGSVTGNGDNVGGLISTPLGFTEISNSYSTGNVKGRYDVGGLTGGDLSFGAVNNCYSIGNVFGNDFVGGICGESIDYNSITNCFVVGSVTGIGESVGDLCFDEYGTKTNIGSYKYKTASLQVGIYSDENSQINVDTNLKLDFSITNLTSDAAYNSITSFLNRLSQKATELGAAQNRLDSALESTMVQMDNLTSSLSTIRDADIGEVSSDFIRQQILQQACATLMSTANQSPSIALQLL